MAREHITLNPEFEVHYHFKRLNHYVDEATVCLVEKDGMLFHGMSVTNFQDPWNRREGNNRARGRAYFAARYKRCPKGGCVESLQGIDATYLPKVMKERKNHLYIFARALADAKAKEIQERYEAKHYEQAARAAGRWWRKAARSGHQEDSKA